MFIICACEWASYSLLFCGSTLTRHSLAVLVHIQTTNKHKNLCIPVKRNAYKPPDSIELIASYHVFHCCYNTVVTTRNLQFRRLNKINEATDLNGVRQLWMGVSVLRDQHQITGRNVALCGHLIVNLKTTFVLLYHWPGIFIYCFSVLLFVYVFSHGCSRARAHTYIHSYTRMYGRDAHSIRSLKRRFHDVFEWNKYF